MSERFFVWMFAVAVCLLFISAEGTSAQSRKAVSAAEVTGTFRSYYGVKLKRSYDEIKIQSIGRGKLKISFDLIYPHLDSAGEMMANVGSTEGEASISGDTAIFTDDSYGECKITIKFVKPGTIKASQDGGCGFGANVTADGTYKKISSAKPKF